MNRVLFLSLQVSESASKGHLNPLIGVAQHVRRQGHEVGWMSLPRAMGQGDSAQVRAAGAAVVPTPPLADAAIPTGEELSRLALDPHRVWEAYRSFLVAPVPQLLDAVCLAIRTFAPDALAIDCMAYAGVIAAHRMGVPYLGVCAGLKILKAGAFHPAYMNDLSPLLPLRQALFERYGLAPEFRLLECLSPFGNVVFTTRDFVGDLALPPNTQLVGPSTPLGQRGDEPAFPWEKLRQDRPVVYAAFGSVHTREGLADIVTPLREAAARLGAQLVVSSEALAAGGSGPAGQDDCLVVPYAPQRQLLERVDAFLTHGGANSVMEALYAGTPLLVVPLSNDQPWQAHLVTRRRVGIHLERGALTADSCTDALARLLPRQSEFRHNLAQVRASYHRHQGAQEAARILLRLAGAP
ncbi:MAG TPA: glycosyltransferase [Gemmataceae bacterium]|nr:glycosyltransferase [Gemmataceae bacterium]